ncbi:putative acyltransferase [Burkholderia multivorans]|uniref:acyltransferase family protein n=1 Tax=Burkholderia multivorans TaxID=87883 RepID=UPI001991CE67|nr:acyltransferase [Burkholderia multivorans]CAB5279523.1 putative acyltransferase [Burkholderia multivorans]CAB5285987.1 putative acyltransferase [Burkholderia multivorans]CAB5287500.1 putative acyltransferase [Burkholderia multivorans]CAB5288538.1 putative acyltransferase [Burkholderia multivorans]CAB5292387.1 putative acyltransferase [Burkholderia multivorans]
MSLRGEIPALTGLRFVAAVSVVAFHAPLFGILPDHWFGRFQLMQGVSFFFVLSGFILQYNYRDSISRIGFARFISLRIAKIWPLHLATLALYFLLIGGSLTFWWNAMTPWTFASVFALLQAWIPNPEIYFAMNGSAWTLSVELFFYMCFPVLCPIIRRAPRITAFASITAVLTYAFIMSHATHGLDQAGLYSVIPFSRIAEFVVGAAVAELRFARTSMKPSASFAGAIEILLLVLVVVWNYLIGSTWEGAAAVVGTALATLWRHTGSMPVFALLLYFYSFNKGIISRLLSSKALIILGETSFALYLVQLPMMRFIGEHFQSHLIAIAIPALLVTAVVGHFAVEMPVYRFTKNAIYPRSRRYARVGDHGAGLENADPS